MMDLSKFRQNYVKDSEADIDELNKIQQSQPIPEGVHEVVISGLAEKDGVKFKIIEKGGGAISFSLIVQNVAKQTQRLYMEIPLALPFKQACNLDDKKVSFVFLKTLRSLKCMQLNPVTVRESVIMTNGESLNLLKGVQFVLVNSWDPKSIHLEYDRNYKSHFFVKSQGTRFESGEMSVPVHIDSKLPFNQRYIEAAAIAAQHHYVFTDKMIESVEVHPTASNEAIQEAFLKSVSKETKKPAVINKTIPAFPGIKKPTAPLEEIEEDIPF